MMQLTTRMKHRRAWAGRVCSSAFSESTSNTATQCGGTLKIIAAIEEPAVIVRILTHLGLPARAPLDVERCERVCGRSCSVGGYLGHRDVSCR